MVDVVGVVGWLHGLREVGGRLYFFLFASLYRAVSVVDNLLDSSLITDAFVTSQTAGNLFIKRGEIVTRYVERGVLRLFTGGQVTWGLFGLS